jgi:hypothetical protein
MRTETLLAREKDGLVREVVSISHEPGKINLYSTQDVAVELSKRLALLGLKATLVRQSICG